MFTIDHQNVYATMLHNLVTAYCDDIGIGIFEPFIDQVVEQAPDDATDDRYFRLLEEIHYVLTSRPDAVNPVMQVLSLLFGADPDRATPFGIPNDEFSLPEIIAQWERESVATHSFEGRPDFFDATFDPSDKRQDPLFRASQMDWFVDKYPEAGVPCATCGAKPGEACLTHSGVVSTRPHRPRTVMLEV